VQQEDGLWLSAILMDPASGRSMEVWSNQPGIQFYTGNFLDGIPGKSGAVYAKNGALCLETQAFPDSINKQGKPGWSNAVLRPGQTYDHQMVHRFSSVAPSAAAPGT
jgi:aldose 1-epimerase